MSKPDSGGQACCDRSYDGLGFRSRCVLTSDEVQAARRRISTLITRTPVMTSRVFDERAKARLYFKCENFQRSGSFKVRGAFNAILACCEQQAPRAVATSSSGNQAAAVALGAKLQGLSAYVAMPKSALRSKVEAVKRYGAEIDWVESKGEVATVEEYESKVAEIVERTGAAVIHPYDDARTIAGQGTCALEFLEQSPLIEALAVPVGGGGLASGVAFAAKLVRPQIRIIGCEPMMADDAREAFRTKQLVTQRQSKTIADGLRTSLGTITFPLILRYVDDVVAVSEESILEAMHLVRDVLKIVVEPSSAVPVAAVLQGLARGHAQHVGIILTGGNV